MSSSGQAPNVSMDDLLASIKSMIEGESSGEANSQVGSNLDSAPGMTPQGVGVGADAPAAPNNALDDGIMDLTQVVSAPQPQAGLEQAGLDPANVGQTPDPTPAQNPIADPNQGAINPLLQGQEPPAQNSVPSQEPVSFQEPMSPQGQVGGQSAQDAASKLDDIFSGMDGGAGLANMSGDIGLPASQVPDSLAPDASADQMSRGLGDAGLNDLGSTEVGMDQAPAQAQMQNELQGQPPLGDPSLGDPAGGMPEGMDGAAAAEQPVVPLDQGEPQFNGGLEGKSPPQSGVPHPGFPADAEAPGLNPAMNAGIGQQSEQQGQQPQMGGEPPRTELMGGHDPRLENDIAMGQALSQADASLNLSTQQLSAQNSSEGQAGQQQMQQQMQQQAQMRGVQPGQMPAQVTGGLQGQVPHPGQAPMGQMGQVPMGQAHKGQAPMGQMGQSPVPHPMQQGQMVAQGQMAPQAQMGQVQMDQTQGQMAQQGHMGMPQMGGPQGGSDMLPVPSGFRPVLPAVHGQGDAPLPGAMGDQLPVEMKNNLEEIVKQLLKPLLRDWLERNLPELLKGVVDEETGKIDPNKW